MRNRYWAMYHSIKFKEYYFKHYSQRTRAISGIFTGFCMIFSSSSVVAWVAWNSVPILWATIFMFVQAIQVVSPIFPFSKQLAALKYLLPQLSKLTADIDSKWLDIHFFDANDEQIKKLVCKFTAKYAKLENTYTGDIFFPIVKSCKSKAEADCKNYFDLYYCTKE